MLSDKGPYTYLKKKIEEFDNDARDFEDKIEEIGKWYRLRVLYGYLALCVLCFFEAIIILGSLFFLSMLYLDQSDQSVMIVVVMHMGFFGLLVVLLSAKKQVKKDYLQKTPTAASRRWIINGTRILSTYVKTCGGLFARIVVMKQVHGREPSQEEMERLDWAWQKLPAMETLHYHLRRAMRCERYDSDTLIRANLDLQVIPLPSKPVLTLMLLEQPTQTEPSEDPDQAEDRVLH